MKKIAGIVLAILVLIVFASGCTSSSNNTSTNNSSYKNQSNSNVTLQITSSGAWSGTYAYNNVSKYINGTGNANYNFGSSPGKVTVSLMNKGNGTLTVQLLQGGNILQTQTTSNNQGTVNINQNF